MITLRLVVDCKTFTYPLTGSPQSYQSAVSWFYDIMRTLQESRRVVFSRRDLSALRVTRVTTISVGGVDVGARQVVECGEGQGGS